MSEPLVVDLFVEDRAHEELLRPLVERAANEKRIVVTVRIRSARGGHGRALDEFRLYQRLVEGGAAPRPDLVVVGIDGNCTSFARKRQEVVRAAGRALADRLVAACPDPHVERWYLADPDAFQRVVGCRPRAGRKKCARDHYKKLLADAVRRAGHPPTLGGIEFARDIAAAMDWYCAEKGDRSFRAFVDDLRKALSALRSV
ncbi:MAG: DUF4276 family protein [Planctomycetota bacterium]